MKKSFAGISLLLFLIPALLLAQDQEVVTTKPIEEPNVILGVTIPKSQQSYHNIGVAAGFVSGFGLSYRHWIPGSKMGFQITATPIYSESKKEDRRYINASLGFNGLTRLAEGEFADLFLYYGAHYWVYQNRRHEDLYDNGSYPYTTRDTVYDDKSELLQFGIGPGVDLHIGRISYNVMVGIRGGFDQISEDRFVKITAETALYYRF